MFDTDQNFEMMLGFSKINTCKIWNLAFFEKTPKEGDFFTISEFSQDACVKIIFNIFLNEHQEHLKELWKFRKNCFGGFCENCTSFGWCKIFVFAVHSEISFESKKSSQKFDEI